MPHYVAVLSDIHGNLPALEAVLAEPTSGPPTAWVLTGDHAAGPLPVQTLDLLRTALAGRAVWISGNADRELAEVRRQGKSTGVRGVRLGRRAVARGPGRPPRRDAPAPPNWSSREASAAP